MKRSRCNTASSNRSMQTPPAARAARRNRNGRNRNRHLLECWQRSTILHAAALPGSNPCAVSSVRVESVAPPHERDPGHPLRLRRGDLPAIACPDRCPEMVYPPVSPAGSHHLSPASSCKPSQHHLSQHPAAPPPAHWRRPWDHRSPVPLV